MLQDYHLYHDSLNNKVLLSSNRQKQALFDKYIIAQIPGKYYSLDIVVKSDSTQLRVGKSSSLKMFFFYIKSKVLVRNWWWVYQGILYSFGEWLHFIVLLLPSSGFWKLFFQIRSKSVHYNQTDFSFRYAARVHYNQAVQISNWAELLYKQFERVVIALAYL